MNKIDSAISTESQTTKVELLNKQSVFNLVPDSLKRQKPSERTWTDQSHYFL